MAEQDQIKKLQDELNLLRVQVEEQQESINRLKARLGIQKENTSPGTLKNPARGFHWSLENFIGLRLIQFIGIIVLVIGLSIGVKYAIDRELISENMRIMLAYGAGVILFLLSLRLKKKYNVFSALLFSGGMASLYFTTYGAFSYYHLFSFGLSFGIMVGLTLYTVYQAIIYNREEIAWLGLVGAYGIPFLISRNEDRPDLLFLYVMLINTGVVFLCIRKQWKNVGRVAMIITWTLFLAWVSIRYKPEQHDTAIGFMIFFFFLFAFSIAGSRMLKRISLDANDTYYLVLNNITLYLSALFVSGLVISDNHVAMVTFIISVFCGLQALLYNSIIKDEIFTIRMHALIAFALFILFIGFNWDGFIVTLLWLICAVVIFGWGYKVRSYSARMAGICLMGATLAKLVFLDSMTFTTIQKVIAYLVLGILLLCVSFFYQKFRNRIFEGKD